MGINVYYFIMSVYGWYYWSRKDSSSKATPVTRNNRKEWFISIAILVISFIILSLVLVNLTDSDVPVIDALTTSIFIVGMQLMAKKKIENWLAWIVGDLISIPLYFYKGLTLTSFQFIIFLIIAVLGYLSWNKSLKSSKK
jgi:nicotinamide mononucleotide transporter